MPTVQHHTFTLVGRKALATLLGSNLCYCNLTEPYASRLSEQQEQRINLEALLSYRKCSNYW